MQLTEPPGAARARETEASRLPRAGSGHLLRNSDLKGDDTAAIFGEDLRRLDRGRMEAWAHAELVRQIGIDSRNGHEDRLGDYLYERVAQLGLAAVLQPVDARRSNLIIGCRQTPELACLAHLDTVHPTWEWKGQAETVGHEVRGLGAQDDKGGIVASLLGWILAGARGVPLDRLPATLALTVDEEEDGSGSAAFAREVRPKRAIVVEATGLDVGIAGAGSVEVEVVLSGRSAHGSLPEQGDNAIDKAARFVVALHRLPVLHQEDLLISPAAVVLQFHGGSRAHVIPDRARVHVDVRIGPSLTASAVYKDLSTLAASYGAEVRPIELAEPWQTPHTSDLVSLLLDEVVRCSGRRSGLVGFPAWTDANNLVELAATETVVFGPGSTFALSHGPDERVDMREVVECSLVIAGLLETIWSRR